MSLLPPPSSSPPPPHFVFPEIYLLFPLSSVFKNLAPVVFSSSVSKFQKSFFRLLQPKSPNFCFLEEDAFSGLLFCGRGRKGFCQLGSVLSLGKNKSKSDNVSQIPFFFSGKLNFATGFPLHFPYGSSLRNQTLHVQKQTLERKEKKGISPFSPFPTWGLSANVLGIINAKEEIFSPPPSARWSS